MIVTFKSYSDIFLKSLPRHAMLNFKRDDGTEADDTNRVRQNDGGRII
ncbi:hypothetical protein LBR03_20100 [Levilactobacillus brevis]|nr:hypothetical protein LBR03_20100 [Levilactobacillus brevis]